MGGMCRFVNIRRFKWKWSSGETWAVNIKYLLCILYFLGTGNTVGKVMKVDPALMA